MPEFSEFGDHIPEKQNGHSVGQEKQKCIPDSSENGLIEILGELFGGGDFHVVVGHALGKFVQSTVLSSESILLNDNFWKQFRASSDKSEDSSPKRLQITFKRTFISLWILKNTIPTPEIP